MGLNFREQGSSPEKFPSVLPRVPLNLLGLLVGRSAVLDSSYLLHFHQHLVPRDNLSIFKSLVAHDIISDNDPFID
jgi:hypothetical protein